MLPHSDSSLLASSGNCIHVHAITHLTHTHNIWNGIHLYWKMEMNNWGRGSASQNWGESWGTPGTLPMCFWFPSVVHKKQSLCSVLIKSLWAVMHTGNIESAAGTRAAVPCCTFKCSLKFWGCPYTAAVWAEVILLYNTCQASLEVTVYKLWHAVVTYLKTATIFKSPWFITGSHKWSWPWLLFDFVFFPLQGLQKSH